jgi:hypothetical protein
MTTVLSLNTTRSVYSTLEEDILFLSSDTKRRYLIVDVQGKKGIKDLPHDPDCR